MISKAQRYARIVNGGVRPWKKFKELLNTHHYDVQELHSEDNKLIVVFTDQSRCLVRYDGKNVTLTEQQE